MENLLKLSCQLVRCQANKSLTMFRGVIAMAALSPLSGNVFSTSMYEAGFKNISFFLFCYIFPKMRAARDDLKTIEYHNKVVNNSVVLKQ